MTGIKNERAALYINGKIYTVCGPGWESRPMEAMAVGADGRILYVGRESEARARLEANKPSAADHDYTVTDLGGRAALPGFVDTHVHMPGAALTELFEIYLYAARDREDTLKTVREFVGKHPEREIYYGTGFYLSIAGGSPEGPRREWLDEIEADKPIMLESSDGHSLWLNTAAMKRCGIDQNTKTPQGGMIHKDAETGEPSGTLTDAHALLPERAVYGIQEETAALRHFHKKMLGWGYTAAMLIAPHFCKPESLKQLVDGGEWRMRANLCALADLDYVFVGLTAEEKAAKEAAARLAKAENGEIAAGAETAKNAVLEAARLAALFGAGRADATGDGENAGFGGDGASLIRTHTVKFFADGVVEGRTAFLKEPYAQLGPGDPEGYRSEPLWDDAALAAAFEEVTRAGLQIHVHSIGDAASAQALSALAEARRRAGKPDGNRDVLTHIQLLGKEEIDAMRALSVIASCQPFWHFKEPNWYDEIDLAALGETRAEAAYPVGAVLRAGVRVTFSGDHPVSPENNPFWAIQNAVTRNLADPAPYGVAAIADADNPKWLRNADERISLTEAIEAYTINGAYQLFRENEIGSLEAGKFADFIVLSADPFEADPVKLYAIKPTMVYINGTITHHAF